MTGPITHVSDTALWVAYYRAMESERPDARFRDPYARRLAGERGEAIMRAMPKGRQMAWPMIVRTAVMDEIIQRVIGTEAVDCVLNLAAGLDARAYRLPLPPALRWIDVDLPAMLDYKASVLAGERPAVVHEAIRMDLADLEARRALLDRVAGSSRSVLVITEGLLVYLEAAQVAELARDLHARPALRFWLMDLASPALLARLEKSWGPVVRAGGAPFRFAPAEGTGFFSPHGWREREYRSTFEESIRLRRSFPLARFWWRLGRLVPRMGENMRRFSGIVLLERAATTC